MATIPPFPADLVGQFDHSLENVIILTTVNMRNIILIGTGVTTIHDLLLIDKESLVNACKEATTVMSKMKLKTLKR